MRLLALLLLSIGTASAQTTVGIQGRFIDLDKPGDATVRPCPYGTFKMSYPPKRTISFSLGDQVYVSNVTIVGYEGRMTPADAAR